MRHVYVLARSTKIQLNTGLLTGEGPVGRCQRRTALFFFFLLPSGRGHNQPLNNRRLLPFTNYYTQQQLSVLGEQTVKDDV